MLEQACLFEVRVDHFQFYVGDRELGLRADTSHMWDGSGGAGSSGLLVWNHRCCYGSIGWSCEGVL